MRTTDSFLSSFTKGNVIQTFSAVRKIRSRMSYCCAEKAGFRLFEKRTVYDYSVGRYCDDYYCFRRYPSWSTCESKFYGDVPYEGRIVNGGEQ